MLCETMMSTELTGGVGVVREMEELAFSGSKISEINCIIGTEDELASCTGRN